VERGGDEIKSLTKPSSKARIQAIYFMKKFLLALFLLPLFSSLKAQTELFGKHKYSTINNEALLYSYILNLNCNESFLMEDSTTNFISTGTWKVKNNQLLVLSTDSVVFKAKKTAENRKVKHLIRDGKLYEEIMTRTQYKRQNKKIDRQIHSCTPGMFEEYEVFEAKQKNRYLLRVESFNCSKSTLTNTGIANSVVQQ
jgi:hypothetical protein